eukprot:1145091-Pelagomonas_calceolata.AAC.1
MHVGLHGISKDGKANAIMVSLQLALEKPRLLKIQSIILQPTTPFSKQKWSLFYECFKVYPAP